MSIHVFDIIIMRSETPTFVFHSGVVILFVFHSGALLFCWCPLCTSWGLVLVVDPCEPPVICRAVIIQSKLGGCTVAYCYLRDWPLLKPCDHKICNCQPPVLYLKAVMNLAMCLIWFVMMPSVLFLKVFNEWSRWLLSRLFLAAIMIYFVLRNRGIVLVLKQIKVNLGNDINGCG